MHRFRFHKGQSLLESLVALSILTSGFLGILTLLAKSFSLNRTVADEITATYLASEGIEIGRGIIYYHLFDGTAHWGDCIGTYDLDFATMTNGGSNCPTTKNPSALYFNQATGLYGQQKSFQKLSLSAVPTPFTRSVTINPFQGNPNELGVTSVVTWGSNRYVLEAYFFNWHP